MDDGLIDPAETRNVLGLAISASLNAPSNLMVAFSGCDPMTQTPETKLLEASLGMGIVRIELSASGRADLILNRPDKLATLSTPPLLTIYWKD